MKRIFIEFADEHKTTLLKQFSPVNLAVKQLSLSRDLRLAVSSSMAARLRRVTSDITMTSRPTMTSHVSRDTRCLCHGSMTCAVETFDRQRGDSLVCNASLCI